MSSDFLLELRCEEIPARMQAGARRDLEKRFRELMAATGVTHGDVTVWSTPRRLALMARGLPLETEAQREEFKGPKVGAPPQALEGFLRKVGLSREKLEERGGTYFATVEMPGRATAEVLAWAIAAIVRTFPWPKSMRWGAASVSTESIRWVRPLSGIVAILGEDEVEFEVGGVQSGVATLGHRFHHPGAITIGGASDYQEKLRACHVIVDHAEREALIREGAAAAAAEAGLALVADEGLVIENAGLTEWPVPLLGRFDPQFLEVPPEVIQLTARTNQKYFVCHDASGKLANAFVCTANIAPSDGGAAIIDGNRKVLAARLADARFFWDQDRRKTLVQHAEKLSNIVFHEKLGTVSQRVTRIATIAADILPELVGWPMEKARQMQPSLRAAAELAKADLVTEMVAEFPELQATMGFYYSSSLGMEISEAIRDQYKPTGPADSLPSNEVGTLLALADKADSLFGFFCRGLRPTGSKDPFALRRAAIGVIRLIVENELPVSLRRLFSGIDYERMFEADGVDYSDPTDAVIEFIIDRLKVQQREAGVRHDLIDAVFALGGEDDLVRLLARVHALQAFVGTPDGTNLLAGYKRAANILKKEKYQAGENDLLSHEPETDEKALIDALDAAEPLARQAVAAEDFAAAMSALASLRGPIDAFFETVTVNDPDPAKRSARLALLDRLRGAVHQVADFSKIEG